MEVLHNLLTGLGTAILPVNLFYCLLGTTVGNLIGILPGIGPVTAMALLLPFTFGRDPASSIIMLAGIYYGAMYGGAATSVLLNIPGEPSAVPTAIEGYPLARQGRAGAALGMSAIASFVAGTVGVLIMTFLSPPLAELAVKFGPPEYFSLMIFGVCLVTTLSGKSILRGWISATIGLIAGTMGLDVLTGIKRFTFGRPELAEGIDFLVAVVALFAISEIMFSLEEPSERIFKKKIGKLLPTREDWSHSFWAMLRGTVIGFLIGIPPGGGPTIGSFIAYGVEQRLSRRPEKFGHGAIEGIASCEAANNSAAVGQMIPLFSLGIPGSPSMAVLFGAFIILGLDPGPFLFQQHPQFVWTVIASMYIGNVMLLAMNLPLIGLFVKLLNVPYKVLLCIILVFAFIGVYAVNNSVFDLGLMIIIGMLGYLLRKMDFSPVPMILGMVLGDKIEMAFRRSLIMSNGNPTIFVTRPISLAILMLTVLFVIFLICSIKKKGITETGE
jgi:putative tricarboxylic transport membrane protein